MDIICAAGAAADEAPIDGEASAHQHDNAKDAEEHLALLEDLADLLKERRRRLGRRLLGRVVLLGVYEASLRERFQRVQGARSRILVDGLALPGDEEQCREGGDSVRFAEWPVLRGRQVDFPQSDIAQLGVCCQLVPNRRELLAVPTPGSVELDEHATTYAHLLSKGVGAENDRDGSVTSRQEGSEQAKPTG